jgi:class 3 adenylate cyclase
MPPERGPPSRRELDPRIEEQLVALSLRDSVARAGVLSYLSAALFVGYGFTSIAFIRRYAPEIELWTNVWPRLLFNGAPLALLGLFVQRARVSNLAKLHVWAAGYMLVFHAAAWIHVWPLVLRGNPGILAYVNGANVYLFSLIFAGVAPPSRYLPSFMTITVAAFVGPLFVISWLGKDPVILRLIVNDTSFALGSGVFLSMLVHRLRVRVARLELEHATDAARFLGPTLTKAIYEDRRDLLESRRKKGFIVTLDLRGYTSLVQGHDEKTAARFMEQYHALVADSVGKLSGSIHKTAGDGHLVSFGLMEGSVDLSDIDDLGDEVDAAEQRRNRALLENAVKCVERIVIGAARLAHENCIETEVRIGAAIDYGEVEIKVMGDRDHRAELDIFGSTIIRATRLESYTKAITRHFRPGESILIVSPSASQFLGDSTRFRMLRTTGNPVRDFPEIAWFRATGFETLEFGPRVLPRKAS